MKSIILFIVFIAFSTARLHLSEIQEKRLNAQSPTTEWYWHTQKLDHFNPQITDTFQQRFYDINEYWDPLEGPLFLYICGEGTCRQPADNSFVVNLAKKYKGRVLALEHRYYGMSHPKENLTTENLQFLTPDQGLADLALFATEKSREFGETYGIPHRRWITVGGSYPGALSAWFREKYPHIAFASLASSGVVKAIADYHEYDGQVYNSTAKSGVECPERYLNITKTFEDIFKQGKGDELIKALGYDGDDLTEGDFFDFIGDIAAGPIQYGKRTDFCAQLSEVGGSLEEIITWLNEFSTKLGIALSEYTASYLQNTTIDFDKNGRQWTYQICSNLGYFQTPSQSTPPTRSQYVAIDYWRQSCKNGFGIDLFPNTKHWNTKYGGKELVGSKIIFTNGGEDPWQHSSVTESDNPTFYPIVIDCDDCAHCVDLGGDHDTDAPELTAARKQITELFGEWISKELKLEKTYPSEAKVGLRELLS